MRQASVGQKQASMSKENSFENEVLPGIQVPRLVISERIQSLTHPKKTHLATRHSQLSQELRRPDNSAAKPDDIINRSNLRNLISSNQTPSPRFTSHRDHGDSPRSKELFQRTIDPTNTHKERQSVTREVSGTSLTSSSVRPTEVPRLIPENSIEKKAQPRNVPVPVSNRKPQQESGSESSAGHKLPIAKLKKQFGLVESQLVSNVSQAESSAGVVLPPKSFVRKPDLVTVPKFIGPIKYYTDQGVRPLLCAFYNMAWKDFANRGRWHMFWANVINARALFEPGKRFYFNDDQLVNHYSTCYHLSRKDNMTRNIKKYRLEMHQAKNPIAAKDKNGNFLYLDLIAPTYLLPFDFKAFVTEFKKHGGLWIVKPCNGAQGQGICLVNKMDQIKQWQERALAEVAASLQDNECYQGFLISRYLANPLLIDGKKFDLRLYVLVTSFKPLRCYYYRQGFCRFCATRYSSDTATMDDKFMHLTNVAIQKHNSGYNRSHGNKWNIKAFRLYMERVYGRKKTDGLFDRILWMIVQSLKAVQPVMDNDRHCYELYGYDCLIDAHLKPWLLEINASPSLEGTTAIDRVIKTSLLSDSMKMAMYERCPHLLGIQEKEEDGSDMPLGDYEVLFLEEPTPKTFPAAKKVKKAMGRYGPAYGPALVDTKAGVKEKPRWNGF